MVIDPNDKRELFESGDDENENDDEQRPNAKSSSRGFDLDAFRLSQDFGVQSGMRKLLTTVPVTKPKAQQFIYVRPGEEWRIDTWMLELKEDREYYFVRPEIASNISHELKPFTIFTYALRGGDVCLWPIRLPGVDGRDNPWWEVAREAAIEHSGKWIRLQSNQQLGTYDLFVSDAELSEPDWPEESFSQLIEIAFAKRKHIIDSEDHIVLRRLRGEI